MSPWAVNPQVISLSNYANILGLICQNRSYKPVRSSYFAGKLAIVLKRTWMYLFFNMKSPTFGEANEPITPMTPIT